MGTLQARILEWTVSSRGPSQPRDWTQVSRTAGGFFTIWMTREVQEYWSGEPILSLGDLFDSGIDLGFPALQVDSLPVELPGKPQAPNSWDKKGLERELPSQAAKWQLGKKASLFEPQLYGISVSETEPPYSLLFIHFPPWFVLARFGI